ncbi:MAG: N-acetylmuramoyl-L-alanine amidase [Desulfamplus sp.]|nr:N-acetylmuramoyl-L-alanine amidase [Desulfamplus sp.]
MVEPYSSQASLIDSEDISIESHPGEDQKRDGQKREDQKRDENIGDSSNLHPVPSGAVPVKRSPFYEAKVKRYALKNGEKDDLDQIPKTTAGQDHAGKGDTSQHRKLPRVDETGDNGDNNIDSNIDRGPAWEVDHDPEGSNRYAYNKTSRDTIRVNSHGDAFITGLRYWSTPNYTRVVIDSGAERPYTHHLLKEDSSLKKPPRLYVDIERSVLGKDVPTHTFINDHLLISARAGQNTPHSVRVVVDIKSFDSYKIFSLNDPFRMVIDVWGEHSEVAQAKSDQAVTMPPGAPPETPIPPEKLSTIGSNADEITASSIAKQLALGVKTIVIDPGHGGKDPGAIGYLKGVYEKDVVLSIALKLARKMRERLKCNVILTRSKDVYLTLEERTAIANTQNADLFISLHCNAARDRTLTGFETYYLNLATDEGAINVAARENATSRKNISDLQSILNDLMKNAKINESSRLAAIVQDYLVKGVSKKYSAIRNLGVKQAPFYVLLGATMPSILIETSFISNPMECKRLINDAYQNALCDAIIDGVEKYIKETDPRAFN